MNGSRSTRTGTEDHTLNASSPAPLALRPKDAARALGIGERKLWQMTNDGEIPHLKLGKCVVYPVDLLRIWLEELAAKGANT